MLTESRLNVYVLDTNLTPRQRERLQAQVQTALRALPQWAFDLLNARIDALNERNLPLVVEARAADDPNDRVLGFGEIEGRPAARLMPRLAGDAIDWEQDPRYVVAKAVAYLSAPGDDGFWQHWQEAVDDDGLRERAGESSHEWSGATGTDLFVEMFAALALKDTHEQWERFPSVRGFFDSWREGRTEA